MNADPTRVPCSNPECGKLLRVPDALRGKTLKCPKCGAPVATAAAGPPVAAVPAAATVDLLLQEPARSEPVVAAPEEVSGRGERTDRILAGVSAVLFHAALLLLIALFGTAGSIGAGPGGESVGFAELDGEQLTNTDDGQLDDSAASSGGDASTDSLTTTVELAVAQPGSDAADGLDLSFAAGGGGGGGGGGGDGFGFGSKGGGGGEASFLGTTARGNRFCIIADNSGSMSGAPLEYVKQEILKTLAEARGGAKFYIVFFNSVGEPQPLPRWANGKTDANALATWIRGLSARGGTTPISGFDIALKIDPAPDVIYFMTDGGFNPAEVGQIDALNKRLKKPSVIHSICFLNNGGEPLLKQIAANAKGTYRFVPGFRRP